eukprot:TRINITY_DN9782_c0_g1_i3.p1 TRINITY_DN9782_c0_g1~~TRINITY_DN9782_c0_g1_i3.p1  ORF type:complete len:1090 (-),score=161.32 TRINITY_DN9782_c0_g1_i3:116-3385(-)
MPQRMITPVNYRVDGLAAADVQTSAGPGKKSQVSRMFTPVNYRVNEANTPEQDTDTHAPGPAPVARPNLNRDSDRKRRGSGEEASAGKIQQSKPTKSGPAGRASSPTPQVVPDMAAAGRFAVHLTSCNVVPQLAVSMPRSAGQLSCGNAISQQSAGMASSAAQLPCNSAVQGTMARSTTQSPCRNMVHQQTTARVSSPGPSIGRTAAPSLAAGRLSSPGRSSCADGVLRHAAGRANSPTQMPCGRAGTQQSASLAVFAAVPSQQQVVVPQVYPQSEHRQVLASIPQGRQAGSQSWNLKQQLKHLANTHSVKTRPGRQSVPSAARSPPPSSARDHLFSARLPGYSTPAGSLSSRSAVASTVSLQPSVHAQPAAQPSNPPSPSSPTIPQDPLLASCSFVSRESSRQSAQLGNANPFGRSAGPGQSCSNSASLALGSSSKSISLSFPPWFQSNETPSTRHQGWTTPSTSSPGHPPESAAAKVGATIVEADAAPGEATVGDDQGTNGMQPGWQSAALKQQLQELAKKQQAEDPPRQYFQQANGAKPGHDSMAFSMDSSAVPHRRRELPEQVAARLRHEAGGSCYFVCILGSHQIQGIDVHDMVTALAEELHGRLPKSVIFVLRGFTGVAQLFGETLSNSERIWHLTGANEQDSSKQAHRNIVVGEDSSSAEAVFTCVGDVYLLIEGGPETSQAARTVLERGGNVVPLRRTGGASSGMHGFPVEAFERPAFVGEACWALLGDTEAPLAASAAAASAAVAGCLANWCRQAHASSPTSVADVARSSVGQHARQARQPTSLVQSGSFGGDSPQKAAFFASSALASPSVMSFTDEQHLRGGSCTLPSFPGASRSSSPVPQAVPVASCRAAGGVSSPQAPCRQPGRAGAASPMAPVSQAGGSVNLPTASLALRVNVVPPQVQPQAGLARAALGSHCDMSPSSSTRALSPSPCTCSCYKRSTSSQQLFSGMVSPPASARLSASVRVLSPQPPLPAWRVSSKQAPIRQVHAPRGRRSFSPRREVQPDPLQLAGLHAQQLLSQQSTRGFQWQALERKSPPWFCPDEGVRRDNDDLIGELEPSVTQAPRASSPCHAGYFVGTS